MAHGILELCRHFVHHSLLSTSQVALVCLCLWPERNVYTLDASELPLSKIACSSICSVLHARGGRTLFFTLLCVHLLVVCICCMSILGFHPIPFINIFSWLSFPFYILFFIYFIFNLFPHLSFFFLASPAVVSAVCWSCFLHDVPRQGHCISITMFHLSSLKKQ